MPLHPTRRGFIAGSLLLPLAGSAAKADDESPSQPPNEEVASLLHRRDELLEQQRQLDERWRIANARLPNWCKPGHKYRDIKGIEFGERVGWPPLSTPIVVEGVGFLVRASIQDLRNLFEGEVGGQSREKAIDNYRASITDLRCQLSKRRCMERMLDLPQTTDWLPIDLEIEAIEERLTMA